MNCNHFLGNCMRMGHKRGLSNKRRGSACMKAYHKCKRGGGRLSGAEGGAYQTVTRIKTGGKKTVWKKAYTSYMTLQQAIAHAVDDSRRLNRCVEVRKGRRLISDCCYGRCTRIG